MDQSVQPISYRTVINFHNDVLILKAATNKLTSWIISFADDFIWLWVDNSGPDVVEVPWLLSSELSFVALFFVGSLNCFFWILMVWNGKQNVQFKKWFKQLKTYCCLYLVIQALFINVKTQYPYLFLRILWGTGCWLLLGICFYVIIIFGWNQAHKTWVISELYLCFDLLANTTVFARINLKPRGHRHTDHVTKQNNAGIDNVTFFSECHHFGEWKLFGWKCKPKIFRGLWN